MLYTRPGLPLTDNLEEVGYHLEFILIWGYWFLCSTREGEEGREQEACRLCGEIMRRCRT